MSKLVLELENMINLEGSDQGTMEETKEPQSERKAVVRARNLTRIYEQGGRELRVLDDVDLDIYQGELVALVGPSGAGKSTLLHSLGLLEHPTSGTVEVVGKDMTQKSDRSRTKMRRHKVGFVYQFHHLLPEFSALENVILPQIIAGKSRKEAIATATDLLQLVGLGKRIKHRPSGLSGGEQQRVAIARAIANGPKLLLADEPTGNLDHKTSEEVFALFKALMKASGLGALVATHNMDLAKRMDRIIELRDGKLYTHK